MLNHLLDKMLSSLDDLGAPIAKCLQPGLSDGEIDRVTEGAGVTLPPGPRSYFRWRNGVPTGPGTSSSRTMGPFQLAPLEELIDYRKKLIAIYSSDPDALEGWPPNWVPLVRTDLGDDLAIDCDEGGAGVIRYVDPESLEEPPALAFDALLRLWIEALEDGSWTLDRDTGYWQRNPERIRALHQESLGTGFL